MPMGPGRYLAQQPDGAWVVVYDGNVSYYDDYNQAAQVYQQLDASSGGGGSTGMLPSNGLGSANQFSNDTLRSLAQSNQMDLDEKKRQFDAQLALEAQKFGLSQQQFDEIKRQFDQKLQTDLSLALLNGAVALKGTPANWLNYAQYTTGGKDIFQRLTGGDAAPAFSAPTGYSQPTQISDVASALGIRLPQQQGTTGGVPSGMYQTVNGPKSLAQMEAELRGAGWGGGEDVATAYARTTRGPVTPPAAGQSQVQGYPTGQPTEMPAPGYKGGVSGTPASGTPSTLYAQMAGASAPLSTLTPAVNNYQPNNPAEMPAPRSKIGAGAQGGAETNPYMTPLPHQINPAVWDSMSSTAKQMILASAEKGNTPSGVWTAEDYLSQLNASRPRGTAPRQVSYNWQRPMSAF